MASKSKVSVLQVFARMSLTVLKIGYGAHVCVDNFCSVQDYVDSRTSDGHFLGIPFTHWFQEPATRRYHAGRHEVTVQVNGRTVAQGHFELRL